MKKGWEIKTLGEVCDVISGNSAPQNKDSFNGKYPFFRTSDVGMLHVSNNMITSRDYLSENGIKNMKLFKKGTILFPKSGASTFLNHRVVMGVDGYVSSHLAAIHTKDNNKTNNFYVFWFLNTIDAKELVQSMNYPSLNISTLNQIPIPIPPIQEQEEIVERLDKGFELIDSLKETAKKNLDNAKELFQSALREELSPKEDWETKKLGEVCEKTKTINPLAEPNRFFKYVDVSCVDNTKLCIEDYVEIIGKEAPSRARRLIQTNDVIFATVRPTLKRIAIIEDDFNNEVCSTGYIVLKAKKDINYKLIFYFLQLDSFIKQMEVLQKGASYPAVIDNDVKSQLISFPKSIKEQEEIVGRLDRIKGYCEELEGNYKRVLELCEELKQGLLREAFEVK